MPEETPTQETQAQPAAQEAPASETKPTLQQETPSEKKQDAAPKEEPKAEHEKADQEDEISEEEEQKLPFPNAAIVRLMKSRMDNEKMIKKEVKIAMNKWLGNLCVNVSKEMNKFPYVMMHLHEFQKATEPYTSMENLQSEKDRILAHLDAIKKDLEKLERDLGKREEDVF